MAKWKWMTAIGVICALAGAGWSFAQRAQSGAKAETLLPQESIIFVRGDGAQEHRAAFEKTAAHDALYKSGLMDFVGGALKKLSGDGPPQAKQAADALAFIGEHGFSVGVTVDPPKNGPPAPWGVIVLHDAAKIKTLVDEFSDTAGPQFDFKQAEYRGRQITHGVIPDSPAQIGWWAEQGHLVIAVGINAVDGAIDVAEGERANITKHPYWAKYVDEQPEFEVTQMGWLDFNSLHEMFGQFPVPAPGATPDEPVLIHDVLVALGLDNLHGVVARSGYQGRQLCSDQVVEAPGERRGLLALGNQAPITLADLPAVPPTQNNLTAVSFDWSAAYDEILNVVTEVTKIAQPEMVGEIDRTLDRVDEELGLNLKNDVLASLGHVHCLYTDSMQGSFGLGSAGAVSIKNPAKLRRAVSTLLRRLAAESRGEVVIRELDKQGRELLVVTIPKFPMIAPTFGFDQEWMVVGLNSQSVEAFLLRQDGKLPKWEPTGTTAATLAAMPQEFTSLSIMDPRDGYRMILSAAPTLIGFAELGMRESRSVPPDYQFPFDVTELPPAEVVVEPLFPNVAMATSSEFGFEGSSRSSLPGIPLLGGNMGGSSGVATSAVLVALLLPAVQQAREAARRSQSMNNLKQLALGMHNYHDTFNHFPSADIPNAELEDDERLSWMVSILPYVEQAPLYNVIDQKAAWNAEANSLAVETMIPVLLNPSVPSGLVNGQAPTHYVGLAGLGEDGPHLDADDAKAGVFAYGKPRRLRDITDGTSNTLMFAEVNQNLGPWAAAQSSIRPLTQQPYIHGPDGFGGNHAGGVTAAFCDGSVRFISENIDPAVMEALVTIAGGEAVDNF